MILKGARVLSPVDNIDNILDIRIENGFVSEIAPNIAGESLDFSGKIITPGLVEMHCHLREPGFEYKETIKSGIESAIAGGYTVICPMANTKPVADSEEIIGYELQKANEAGRQIVFPIAAVTKGLDGQSLVDFSALKKAGAIAFSDDGRPLENLNLLKHALLTGELIISHAEDSILLTDPMSEAVCVARELEVLREVGGRLHFAHISTKRALELIRAAKNEGLQVTCETAPHYFTFTRRNVTEDGRFKMNPPLRSQEDLDAVIIALEDGTIDCIATDHAPHSLEEKSLPFERAPFGIVGFETAFGASFELVKNGFLTLPQLVEKMSSNPAKILKLENGGRICKGIVANLAIFDIEESYTVCETNFKSKCKISPFEGMRLSAKPLAVVVNGEFIKIEK